MSPIGRRKKTPAPKRRRNRETAETAACRAMLAEIVQRVKVFKKATGGIKPRWTMRDLNKELGHGG